MLNTTQQRKKPPVKEALPWHFPFGSSCANIIVRAMTGISILVLTNPCQVSRTSPVRNGPLLWPLESKASTPLESKGRADPAYGGVGIMTPADTGEHLSRTVVGDHGQQSEVWKRWGAASGPRYGYLVGSDSSSVPTAQSGITLRAWGRVGYCVC